VYNISKIKIIPRKLATGKLIYAGALNNSLNSSFQDYDTCTAPNGTKLGTLEAEDDENTA